MLKTKLLEKRLKKFFTYFKIIVGLKKIFSTKYFSENSMLKSLKR